MIFKKWHFFALFHTFWYFSRAFDDLCALLGRFFLDIVLVKHIEFFGANFDDLGLDKWTVLCRMRRSNAAAKLGAAFGACYRVLGYCVTCIIDIHCN